MNAPAERFTWAVRALAQSAPVQAKLFPEFVSCPFELITGFEETYTPDVIAKRRGHWSDEQVRKLNALERQLSRMSRADKEDVWDDDDCMGHPDWEKVRQLAREVVVSFGWPETAPHTHAL